MVNEENARQTWDYWYPLVYGYFFKRVNNRADVEEMTSTTITSLLLKEDVQSPKAFIWQTAKNQLLLYITKKTKQPNIGQINEQTEANYIPEESMNESDEPVNPRYQEVVNKLIECVEHNLTVEEVKITKMSIIEEQNSTQISQALNLKANTIRQKLKRAIYKLKQKCVDIWHEFKPE